MVVIDLVDDVGEEVGHGEHFDFVAGLFEGDGVRYVEFREFGVFDAVVRRARKYRVGDDGADRERTVVHHQVGGLGKCAGGVDDVVNDDYVLALDVANDGHLGNFVGLLAVFVADDHRHAEEVAVLVGTLAAADVGRGDDEVFEFERVDEGYKDC